MYAQCILEHIINLTRNPAGRCARHAYSESISARRRFFLYFMFYYRTKFKLRIPILKSVRFSHPVVYYFIIIFVCMLQSRLQLGIVRACVRKQSGGNAPVNLCSCFFLNYIFQSVKIRSLLNYGKSPQPRANLFCFGCSRPPSLSAPLPRI